MIKKIFVVYVIGIHSLLGIVIIKSDFIQRVESQIGFSFAKKKEITDHFKRMISYHSRMDGNVPANSVIFIGDSITQGLAVSAVATPSVNYGIGSDTTVGVLQRLPNYKSVERASVVVVAIGMNDMYFRSNEDILHNYKAISDQLPKNVPVVFSAILPIDKEAREQWNGVSQDRISNLNYSLNEWVQQLSSNRFFVDAGPMLTDKYGNLADEFCDGDGVHLNSQGNAVWIQILRKQLENIQSKSGN